MTGIPPDHRPPTSLLVGCYVFIAALFAVHIIAYITQGAP